MHKLLVAALAVCVTSVSVFAGPKVSILGDSYSTFEGAIPKGNAIWYFAPPNAKNGVESVEMTWWHIAIKELGGTLEKCEAFSGATISATGYGKADYSDRSFVTRAKNLGNPDLIFVCGGTNDSWCDAPIGEAKWRDWTNEDLKAFKPSMGKLCTDLKKLYPKAKIVFILNDGLKPEINEFQRRCCKKFGFKLVELRGVSKQDGHPDAEGMRTIADQVVFAVSGKHVAPSAAGADAFAAGDLSCEISDAGVVKNLKWKGQPLALQFFELNADANLVGAPDNQLKINQSAAARGRAKTVKNADGSLVTTVDYPVKGASGTEYYTVHSETKVSAQEIRISATVTKSRDFSFGNMVIRGESSWPLAFMGGAKVDTETWDGKHTLVEFAEGFDKKNTGGGFVKCTVNGKLGNWQTQMSGGYFSSIFDMRQWSQQMFKILFVPQDGVAWGGTRQMPAKMDFSCTFRACDAIDTAAIEKAKKEAELAAQKAAEEAAAKLKPLVAKFPSREALWSFTDADHEKTAARERFSLNGLWAFKVDNDPQLGGKAPLSSAMHTFLKVPGKWPKPMGKWSQPNGLALYNEKGVDVFGTEVQKIDCGCYARKVKIPADWAGRHIRLDFAWLPSAVVVYVDGAKAGEEFFPGGSVDLTGKLGPGEHEITIFTSAKLPERMVQVFDAPDQVHTATKKGVENPGLNGDVTLCAEPTGLRITDVQVRSNLKDKRIDFSIGFEGETPSEVTAVADVYDGAKKVKSFTSKGFTAKPGERFVFGGAWADPKLWDTDAPQNVYTVKVRLEKGGKAVDELYAEEFGYREVRVEGRNVLLNGSPYHMRPEYSNYCTTSALAPEDIAAAAKNMRAHGFNFEIDGNYAFDEGSLAMLEFSIREYSKNGIPSVCGLVHPNQFYEKEHFWSFGPRYDRIVKHMIRRLQNVPGLFFWSSTHNAAGYEADQNPEIISGRDDEIPSGIISWRQRFRGYAKTVTEKLAAWDPVHPVYHHESGALCGFYTLNNYSDWAPIQERSDWYEHWEKEGVMPIFIVEYGTPHLASWSSYRGEDNGRNIWSARGATQTCWLDEFNSSIIGERAFHASPVKQRNLELAEFHTKGNKPVYFGAWNKVQYEDEDLNEVLTLFAKRNYRDLRARGVTMLLPWDILSTMFIKDPNGLQGSEVRSDPFKDIKRLGVVRSDYRIALQGVGGYVPRKGIGTTLVASYSDLLGWIAGPAGSEFTTVNDTFREGETVEKSLVILNDTRHPQTIGYVWKCGAASGKGSVEVPAGGRKDVPVKFSATAGSAKIVAGFRCTETGWSAKDSFAINVIPSARKAKLSSKVSLFDPEGTAKSVLQAIGVKFTEVTSAPKDGILVIGRKAYAKLPFALKDAVAAGVKTVLLEQDTDSLKKLGFRIQEHGLRNLYAMDPAFDGLDLTDWRGNSTMLPWYIGVDKMSGDFPRWQWEGFKNSRVWRAGNRGTVSIALPEKPTRGDFRPILEGGFDLQYAPVMEYSAAGQRLILSQLDICGRSVSSPESEETLAKILEYADRPFEKKSAKILVIEGTEGKVAKTFAELGIPFEKTTNMSAAKAGDILVVGPDAPAGSVESVAKSGVKVLALGLTGDAANTLLPGAGATNAKWESFPDFNASLATEPLFRGVSNADIQWTYPSCLAGRARFGNDVLVAKKVGSGVVVFSSVAPWLFDAKEQNLRLNRRRAQGLVTRLVCNLGGTSDSGFLTDGRSLYVDKPIATDDPYRYWRW